MTDLEEEIMIMIAEYLDGRIEIRRFRRFENILLQNRRARDIYRDMILLRTGLEKIFRHQTKASDTSIPLDVCD